MEERHYVANRGVSEIIGAILVFGLVVISLALFQTTAVPSANEQVEFDHNQRVQTDLLGLDAELSDAAATGNGGTAIVTVGMDYPTRFLFRNPPPVSGTLSTSESGFTIENAEAVGDTETGDYWDGTTPRPYTSREIAYRVDYNVYDRAPTTVLSHGVVYDRFPDGTTRRIDAGGFIDGRSIELTALDGRRDGSRVGALSVPVNAQSAPTETVRVRDDPDVEDDNIRLTVRTDASATAWESFLSDEMVSEGGHVDRVLGPDDDDTVTPGTVAVVLEEGVTYDLELARVAVDSAPYDPEPAYVTAVGDTDRSVTAGQPTDLTVEVRDEYNGPVPGEEVTFRIDDGGGTTTTETVTTNSEGRATISYTPSDSVTLTATVPGWEDSEDDPLSAVFDLTVTRPGSDDETQGSDGELNPGGDNALTLTTATLRNCSPPNSNFRTIPQTDDDCRVDTTFENRGSARTITAVRVNVYSASQEFGIPKGENGKGNPDPRRRPDEWAFGTSTSMSDDQEFADGSLTLSSPQTIPADTEAPYTTQTYRFEFELDDERYNAAQGDFFVLTVRFEDGSTSTYVVAPQD